MSRICITLSQLIFKATMWMDEWKVVCSDEEIKIQRGQKMFQQVTQCINDRIRIWTQTMMISKFLHTSMITIYDYLAGEFLRFIVLIFRLDLTFKSFAFLCHHTVCIWLQVTKCKLKSALNTSDPICRQLGHHSEFTRNTTLRYHSRLPKSES